MTRITSSLVCLAVITALAVTPGALAGGGTPRVSVSFRRVGSSKADVRVTIDSRGSATTYSLSLISYGTHCGCELVHELFEEAGEIRAGERSKTIEHDFRIASGETYSLGVGAENGAGEVSKDRQLVVR